MLWSCAFAQAHAHAHALHEVTQFCKEQRIAACGHSMVFLLLVQLLLHNCNQAFYACVA